MGDCKNNPVPIKVALVQGAVSKQIHNNYVPLPAFKNSAVAPNVDDVQNSIGT